MTNKSLCVKKISEKNLKSMNKVHLRLYKMKQRQKNVLHLNNIRKKNTLLINKAKGCALVLSGQIKL